jgi:hypothetical protein
MSEHNSQVEEVFTEASQQVLDGESIEAVLSRYPAHAPELEPLLELNVQVRSLPLPGLSPRALQRITEGALNAAEEQRDASRVVPLRPMVLSTVNRAGTRGWGSRVAEFRNSLRSMRMGVMVAGVVLLLCAVGVLTLQEASEKGTTTNALEYYSGVITGINGDEWAIDNNTHVLVDNVTEIHGNPVVGATMSCIAERLPGVERYRALEVWIHPAPGMPNVPPLRPSGVDFSVLTRS